MSQVRARLIAVVVDLLGPEAGPLEPFPVDCVLSDLGLTSIKMVNLMLAVEAAFGIAIPPEDITPQNFHSVATIECLVTRHLERGVAA